MTIKDLFGDNYLSKEEALECFQEVMDEYEKTIIEIKYFCYNQKKQTKHILTNVNDIKSIFKHKNPLVVVYYELTIYFNTLQYPNRKDITKDFNDKVLFCLVRLGHKAKHFGYSGYTFQSEIIVVPSAIVQNLVN